MSENDFVNYMTKLQNKNLDLKGENRPEENDLHTIYEEVLDIMEFGEKDMYGEYFAALGKRVDVYFLPILPTDVITIKTDDLKKVNPQLQETIIKYAHIITFMPHIYCLKKRISKILGRFYLSRDLYIEAFLRTQKNKASGKRCRK